MKIIICLLVLLTLASAADCPYSGVGRLTHNGIVVSKWEDIDETGCWGVCPETVNAIEPINKTGYFEYVNDSWVEMEWTQSENHYQNTPVINWVYGVKVVDTNKGDISKKTYLGSLFSSSTTNPLIFDISMLLNQILIG